MSPEQTGRMTQYVDHRTDFYALGATFYEMLTGRTPFEGRDALEILHAHLARTPRAPHRVNASVPLPLSQIVLKLLEKNPQQRYQSADGLKADLERCAQSWKNGSFIEPFALGARDFSGELRISSQLYGRENEIEQLRQSFAEVKNGATEMIFVAGYSGIGKSSLVRAIRQSMAQNGAYFVSGKFEQFRRDEPYSALLQALRQLLVQIVTEDESALQRWKETPAKRRRRQRARHSRCFARSRFAFGSPAAPCGSGRARSAKPFSRRVSPVFRGILRRRTSARFVPGRLAMGGRGDVEPASSTRNRRAHSAFFC